MINTNEGSFSLTIITLENRSDDSIFFDIERTIDRETFVLEFQRVLE